MTNTAKHFNVKEVSADKAYSSRANLELAKKLGAMPYIPFKKNTTGRSKGSPTWTTMFELFNTNYIELYQSNNLIEFRAIFPDRSYHYIQIQWTHIMIFY